MGGRGRQTWSPEPDDYLHDFDPVLEKQLDKQWEARFPGFAALFDTASLVIVILVILGLFAGFVLPLSRRLRFRLEIDLFRRPAAGRYTSSLNVSHFPLALLTSLLP